MRVKNIRRAHRYLGLLIGIQLLAWTVSGLYFSWNPIEEVRGEHLAAESAPVSLSNDSLVSPTVVVKALSERHGEVSLHSLELRSLFDDPIYEATYRAGKETHVAIADARTGSLRGPLVEEEAIRLARADFTPDVPVRNVERLEAAPDGSEYRGVTLPAYRVVFDHPSDTRIYVSADRARVEARRNSTWRWFDWLWMLHIMDYDARSDFNHLLLQAFSVFGLITVASGFLLGGVTSPWLRGRFGPADDSGDRDAETRPAMGPK